MKTVAEIQEEFESGKPLYRDEEVLTILYKEIGFGPTTIGKRIFKGEVKPYTIRYHLRRHGLLDEDPDVDLWVDSEGYYQLKHENTCVPLHRLLATLKEIPDRDGNMNEVNLADLRGSRVSFADGCKVNLSLDNLEVKDVNTQEVGDSSELDQIQSLVDQPMNDSEKVEIAQMMDQRGFCPHEISSVLKVTPDRAFDLVEGDVELAQG